MRPVSKRCVEWMPMEQILARVRVMNVQLGRRRPAPAPHNALATHAGLHRVACRLDVTSGFWHM